jgi:hypothetical protein
LLELLALRFVRFQSAELQPLSSEVLGQRLGALVRQHSSDLQCKLLRVPQFAAVGCVQQRLIRHAAPQKI